MLINVSLIPGDIKEIQSNDTLVDYNTAASYCKDVYQGTLAVIKDQDQNNEILQQLRGDEVSGLSCGWREHFAALENCEAPEQFKMLEFIFVVL